MIEKIIKIVIIAAVLSLLVSFIPDTITASMDSAIVYVLSSVNSLYFVFHPETALLAIGFLFNVQIGVAIFWIFHWILRLIHA